MKKYLLFIALLSTNKLYAQLWIKLDKSIRHNTYEKALNPLPVFMLRNQSMEMGIAEGRKEQEIYPVRLPDLADAADTGYMFLYFGGVSKGYVPILIANYASQSKDPLLYIDHNVNFDFSDDGPAVAFLRKSKELFITIRNPADTNACLQYRLSRFNFFGKDAYRDMMEEYYKLQEKSRKFVGLRYSFREQRLNIKSGLYAAANDSLSIGLLDINCNGIYNEVGVDKILVGDYHAKVLQTESDYGAVWVGNDKKAAVIEHRSHYYYVKISDPYGQSLQLDESQEDLNTLLPEGAKAPKLRFRLWNDKKLKLKKLRKYQVYLYFMQFSYDQFLADSALFARMQRQHPRLKIIWLQYGGNPNNMRIVAGMPNVQWYLGYSDKKINRQLGVKKFPFGIWLDRKRRVKKYGIKPDELEQWLMQKPK